MKVFIKQDYIFYRLENGKVTAVNLKSKSIKVLVCVPSIYTKKLEIITENDFEKAIKEIGL